MRFQKGLRMVYRVSWPAHGCEALGVEFRVGVCRSLRVVQLTVAEDDANRGDDTISS